MKRLSMPGGWYIKPDDDRAVETEWWLYDEKGTGIMIAAFDEEGAMQFAAAMNSPRLEDYTALSHHSTFAAGYKAGQIVMRERASNVCPDRPGHEWVRGSLWNRVADRMKQLIYALPIEELA